MNHTLTKTDYNMSKIVTMILDANLKWHAKITYIEHQM